MLPTGASALHILVVLTLAIREAVETAHNCGCPAPVPVPEGGHASYYYYYGTGVQTLTVARESTRFSLDRWRVSCVTFDFGIYLLLLLLLQTRRQET